MILTLADLVVSAILIIGFSLGALWLLAFAVWVTRMTFRRLRTK